MKTAIPEKLKKEAPQTRWGKILTVTPVVATLLAEIQRRLKLYQVAQPYYEETEVH